ncbi:hypothetical protein C8R48DRAFT_443996 [Suillus tomentosus]|nr:hypothetical protein C8R48DRAFT_443996 [Suillus tomentosus]
MMPHTRQRSIFSFFLYFNLNCDSELNGRRIGIAKHLFDMIKHSIDSNIAAEGPQTQHVEIDPVIKRAHILHVDAKEHKVRSTSAHSCQEFRDGGK